MSGVRGFLGCAQEYRAVVHWRGGAQVYMQLPQITSCTWDRSLSATSEAVVRVPKNSLNPACCQQIGNIEPWCHELTIYRDDELVWQGPIRKTIERRGDVEIQAADMTAWLARLVNRYTLDYKNTPATLIAADVVRRNLMDTLFSVPVDYPHLLEFMKVDVLKVKSSFNKGRWIEYVLDIIIELAKLGFHWTTVGRTFYLRDRLDETSPSQGRFTSAEILGDMEVVRSGLGAATAAFASIDDQTAPGETPTLKPAVWWGETGTVYGRLDRRILLSDPETSTEELLVAARLAVEGRYPAPLYISMPDNGAKLAPTTPVTMAQLVCGEKFDIAIADYCRVIDQSFRLSGVDCTWGAGGESVSVRMTPLTITGDDEEGGGDDDT